MVKDPYKYYRVEARELLGRLTQGVLELEKGRADKDLVGSLLRLAHTLKGASRIVKQPAIAELAHAVEGVLTPYREGQELLAREHAGELLQLADGIAARLTVLEAPREPAAAALPRPSSEGLLETVRVEVEEVDAVVSGLSEAGAQIAGIRQEARGLQEARRLAGLLAEQWQARGQDRNGTSGARVRSRAEELSDCLERLERGFRDRLEGAERDLAQARERAHHLRLLTAAALFPSLAQAARDAALALGKRVELETAGGDARLDAHVLVVLRDALLHLVRNAVAHGIEPETARRAAGKTAAGRVQIHVERRGSRVAFLCRDDGRGLDVAAIRRAAVERGAIPAAQAETLGLPEAIGLILRGGISTTATVTELSGRGVGLDVVREAAARLKGKVSIESAPGRGTTVEVCVPVSLTSLQALLVEAAGMAAAIPLEAVLQSLRLPDCEIARAGTEESILYSGEAIPFLPLSEALRRRIRGARRPANWSAAVIASEAALAAIGVDRLLGTRTVVVRSLPDLMAADPVVAGLCQDAEGNPQLVLDPGGLVAAARRSRAPAAETAEQAQRPILVIDDSLTTRMLEQSILESSGHAVELATSGEEALEKARDHRYSLFLVDVEMPGMDGFEFVARVQRDPLLRSVPAILVTSRNSPEDRRRGEEVGARAYIVKSEFDQGFLLQTVRQLVG